MRPTPKSGKGNEKEVKTKNKPFILNLYQNDTDLMLNSMFQNTFQTSVDAETRAQALTPSPGDEATFTSIPK